MAKNFTSLSKDNIAQFISDFNILVNKVGDLTQLNTLIDSDLVSAVNELQQAAVLNSELLDSTAIKTLQAPNNTTISTFGATLIDDDSASTARNTLDAAGRSADNTFSGNNIFQSNNTFTAWQYFEEDNPTIVLKETGTNTTHNAVSIQNDNNIFKLAVRANDNTLIDTFYQAILDSIGVSQHIFNVIDSSGAPYTIKINPNGVLETTNYVSIEYVAPTLVLRETNAGNTTHNIGSLQVYQNKFKIQTRNDSYSYVSDDYIIEQTSDSGAVAHEFILKNEKNGKIKYATNIFEHRGTAPAFTLTETDENDVNGRLVLSNGILYLQAFNADGINTDGVLYISGGNIKDLANLNLYSHITTVNRSEGGDVFFDIKASSSGAGNDDDVILRLRPIETGEAVIEFWHDNTNVGKSIYTSETQMNFSVADGDLFDWDFDGHVGARLDKSGGDMIFALHAQDTGTNTDDDVVLRLNAKERGETRIELQNNGSTDFIVEGYHEGKQLNLVAPSDGTIDFQPGSRTAYVANDGMHADNYYGGNAIFAFGYFSVSSGTPTLSQGFNVSSITDHGVGNFRVNYSTAATNISPVPVTVCNGSGSTRVFSEVVGHSSSSFDVDVVDTTGAFSDPFVVFFQAVGD